MTTPDRTFAELARTRHMMTHTELREAIRPHAARLAAAVVRLQHAARKAARELLEKINGNA
jgi:hypothetical protein